MVTRSHKGRFLTGIIQIRMFSLVSIKIRDQSNKNINNDHENNYKTIIKTIHLDCNKTIEQKVDTI